MNNNESIEFERRLPSIQKLNENLNGKRNFISMKTIRLCDAAKHIVCQETEREIKIKVE